MTPMPQLLFLLFYLLLLMPTSSAQIAPFNREGHRGCRGLMPENTLPAFLKALDLGMNVLELDVVISKDRQVVVSHDPFFHPDFSIAPDGKPVPKRPKINLYQLDYEQIRQYDVGSNGHPDFPEQQKLKTHKPLLREVIQAAEAHRQKHHLPLFLYNIEIKSEVSEYDVSQPQPGPFCDLVYADLSSMLPMLSPERVIIQSFDFNILKYWKQQTDAGRFPKMTLAALVANLKGIEKNLEHLGFKPDVYSPYYQLLNAAKVQRLHAMGISVIPWTVNSTKEMKHLIAMGVDGIITDYPNRVPK
ncbi:MAG: glycerophosphodiester phosphodiesterase family protein [Spirosomataceae bacterium]